MLQTKHGYTTIAHSSLLLSGFSSLMYLMFDDLAFDLAFSQNRHLRSHLSACTPTINLEWQRLKKFNPDYKRSPYECDRLLSAAALGNCRIKQILWARLVFLCVITVCGSHTSSSINGCCHWQLIIIRDVLQFTGCIW